MAHIQTDGQSPLPPSHADYLLCCDADLLGRGVVLSPEMLAEARWNNGLATAAEQRRQRGLVNRRRHLIAMAGKGFQAHDVPFVGSGGCQCPPTGIRGDCPFSYANGFHARTRTLRGTLGL